MSVTIKNVAEQAGLSWQTVSKVLNGHGHLFRPETRQRVISAAHEMGYVPNAAARSMRSQKTRQIGLLLRNEDGHRFHNLAAFTLLLGINSRLEPEDYLLTVVRIGDIGDRRRSRVFREHVIDGLIAFSRFPDAVADWVTEQIPHCIWVDSNRDDEHNCLRRDETQVGQCVAKQIVNLGYRKVLWAGMSNEVKPQSHFSIGARRNAIAGVCAEHGIAFDTLAPWSKPEQKRWVYTQLPQLLKPDTVVVAYNTHAAQAVLVEASSLGLSIGRDYGLICCDETPEVYEAWPGLCRVSNDRFEMGNQAADMMLSILNNKTHQATSRRIPGQWIIGNTAWGSKRT